MIAAQVRAPKRAKVLRALADAPDMELTTAALRETVGDCRDALNALCKMGFVKLEKRESLRRPYGEMERLSAQDPELTRQQEDVLAELLPAVETGKGEFFYGVTGSGKTEVFIRAVRRAAQMGKTAIVLVPEIALTPQMVSLVPLPASARMRRCSIRACLRASDTTSGGASGGATCAGHRRTVGDLRRCKNVGLIIIDEEHEQSYIADNNPHYDARRLAHERCAREGAALLLASATPSMRLRDGRARGFEAAGNAEARQQPPDADGACRRYARGAEKGNRSVFSGALVNGLDRCLKSGRQAILFINRRGFSTFVSCRSCGYVVTCSQCDVSMTYHSAENVLRCHYCGQEAAVPKVCPECGSPYIKYFGVGTQRVEEEVHRLFPDVPTLRMDNDTTRTKDAHATLIERFRRGEARILVGTQMIAKGLDFPNVTMVGIVAADAMLKLPDYRSAERTFQLLTQAGRGARGCAGRGLFADLRPRKITPWRPQAARITARFLKRRCASPPRAGSIRRTTLIARLLFEADDEKTAQQAAETAMRLMEAFFERRAYLKNM